MLNALKFTKDRFTLCDSGAKLNKLMHPFLFVTLALSIGFLFFDASPSIQAFTLYSQSVELDGLVNLWGIIGIVVSILHTLAFLIRGKIGVTLMGLTIFGGAYLWLYASAIYLIGGFFFQFLVFALPNVFFWAWYYTEWGKRRRGEEVAFV